MMVVEYRTGLQVGVQEVASVLLLSISQLKQPCEGI